MKSTAAVRAEARVKAADIALRITDNSVILSEVVVREADDNTVESLP
jgi:hypothetical protein